MRVAVSQSDSRVSCRCIESERTVFHIISPRKPPHTAHPSPPHPTHAPGRPSGHAAAGGVSPVYTEGCSCFESLLSFLGGLFNLRSAAITRAFSLLILSRNRCAPNPGVLIAKTIRLYPAAHAQRRWTVP